MVEKKVGFEVKQTATNSDGKQLRKLGEKLGLEKNFLISRNFVEGLDDLIYAQFL